MAHSSFSFPWTAGEVDYFFNSMLSPEYSAYLSRHSWDVGTLEKGIERSPVNLHLDTRIDMNTVTEDTNALHFLEATHSSLVPTERLVNDETAAGQDPEHGHPRTMTYGGLVNTVIEEHKATEYEVDLKYGVETSHEPKTEMLVGCVKIAAALDEDELATAENTALATDHEASMSPLVESAHASPSTDGGSRLEYQLETQTDGMKGPISMDHTHVTCLVEGARALMELAHTTPGGLTGGQAVQYEGEASEYADRDEDVLPAVSEHGPGQCYQTTSYKSSSQSATNDERLGIDVTEQQGLDVATADGAGVDLDCEAGSHDVSPSRRESLNMRSSEAQVGPGVSDNEDGHDPARNGSVQTNSEGESDEMAQTSSTDTSGSKDNPISLDDEEEPPRRSSLPSTLTTVSRHDSSVDDSDESSQVTAQPPNRPTRKKRKRCYEGMHAWGSAEFQASEAENLESAWLSVQTRWWAMETHVSELKGLSLRLERLAIDFDAYWFDLCVTVRQSGSIGASNVAQLIDHWRRVEQELETVQGNRKMKRKVLEFRQTLDWLEDKTALYDCIEEFSNSIDRKDEDKDEDFEDEGRRRSSKTQRR